MKQEVIDTISNAIKGLQKQWGLSDMPQIDVEIPKSEAHGDMSTTLAMSIAKSLKKPPRKIAEELLAEIKKQEGPFEKVEIAGAGFINFTFKREYFYQALEKLLNEEHSYLKTDIGKGKKIQIEFVSANPTGPLHIGHGRGAAVGNALSNILKSAGYDVEREYYINDAGVQVLLLGRSIFAKYMHLCGVEGYAFPDDGYKGDYIEDIALEFKKKFGEKYYNSARTKGPQEGIIEAQEFAYKKMLNVIKKDLEDFGVYFDSWQSERELYQRSGVGSQKSEVEESIYELKKRGYLYERDGAKWFSSTRFGDDKDRVVVKKNGEYTYFASDIAYHKDKLNRGFDIIIDIWGADHHGYMPRLSSVLEAFNFPKEKFKVILIQMVTLLRHGKPVQMSKRAGEFITLREVIDEVGADTTKFIFLTRRPDSHLEFDIEVAKEQSAENPVFYVQYAFARISSIFKQAVEKKVMSSELRVKSEESRGQGVDLSVLKENEELSIIKKLSQYPIIFEGAVLSFEPHRITYYLQELAGMFHSYYNRHRVISEDKTLTTARLCLCKAVQIVLEEGLKILGVNAPERM